MIATKNKIRIPKESEADSDQLDNVKAAKKIMVNSFYGWDIDGSKFFSDSGRYWTTADFGSRYGGYISGFATRL